MGDLKPRKTLLAGLIQDKGIQQELKKRSRFIAPGATEAEESLNRRELTARPFINPQR